jgi:hypothetical protein
LLAKLGILRVMKKPLLAVLLTTVALAVLGDVGVKLVGSLRQIGVMTNTTFPADPEPSFELERQAPPPPAAVETAIRIEPARAALAPAAPMPERAAPEPAPVAFEPADLPGAAFDPEGALHAAAEADPNVAELLNDADPAVGAAVRDFVYTLAAPGASTSSR